MVVVHVFEQNGFLEYLQIFPAIVFNRAFGCPWTILRLQLRQILTMVKLSLCRNTENTFGINLTSDILES